MFPKFSQIIKSSIPTTTPQVPSSSLSKFTFIVLNVITGFIAATTFFITRGIQKQFSPLESIISTDYENYLQVAIILAFVAVILTIYGCHCADIKSIAATTVYLVLTSITFVGYLLFITYFLMFKERIAWVVNENFDKLKNFEINNVEGWLGCAGPQCKEAVLMTIGDHLQQLVVICSIIIGCQLLCKFIGTKFLSDIQQEQRAISISYILNDFESSKQTILINQQV